MSSINLTISEKDYTLILGALRECVAAIEGWEMPVRVGGTAAEITATSLRVRMQGDEQGARE